MSETETTQKKKRGGGPKPKAGERGPYKFVIHTRLTKDDGASFAAHAKALNITEAELARRILEAGLLNMQFV